MMDSPAVLDCLVVGAGPAGLTAALYLRRFHRRVQLVDAGDSRARRIPLSRNYPGFPDGVRGSEILARLERQLARAGGEVRRGTVSALSGDDARFLAEIGGERVAARTVLLATGVSDNEPRIAGLRGVREAGLLRQCPICDAYDHSGCAIGIVGRGEHGAREALFIRDFSDDVRFIAEGDDLAGETRLRLEMQGVRVVPGRARETAVDGTGGVRVSMDNGDVHRFDVLYAALGTKPRAHLAEALGARLDERGNVVVDAHCRTDVERLYAAGDLVSALDQLVVATGHAAIAATAIHNALRAQARDDAPMRGRA